MLIEKSSASREISDYCWWAFDPLLFRKRPSIARHRLTWRARACVRFRLSRLGRPWWCILVKEGPADGAIAFERTGQFQAPASGN
jgi:hypothetical protein